MDRQSVYTLSLFGEERSATDGEHSNKQTHNELVAFVLDFHLDGNYIYRYADIVTSDGAVITRVPLTDATTATKSARTSSQNNTTATSTLPI
jgi:DNA replication licensing factor MCM5